MPKPVNIDRETDEEIVAGIKELVRDPQSPFANVPEAEWPSWSGVMCCDRAQEVQNAISSFEKAAVVGIVVSDGDIRVFRELQAASESWRQAAQKAMLCMLRKTNPDGAQEFERRHHN